MRGDRGTYLSWRGQFSMMWAIALLVLTSGAAIGQTMDKLTGAAACLECHESDKIMGILKTPHADFKDPRSPAARDQCESCHGPSATHMKFPMQVGNIVFTKHGKTPIGVRNRACLECHNKGDQAHWNEGAHAKELSCASCHVMHKPQDPMVGSVDRTADCVSCHETVLESAPAPSSHPLTGPKAIVCTECHSPHGPTSLTTCITCHAQDPETFAKQSAKARDYHGRASSKEIECTACHKGFVHSMPPITLAEPTDAP